MKQHRKRIGIEHFEGGRKVPDLGEKLIGRSENPKAI